VRGEQVELRSRVADIFCGVGCSVLSVDRSLFEIGTMSTPLEVADRHEMLGLIAIDEGDSDEAQRNMDVAHAIRHLHGTLSDVWMKINSGYCFNADRENVSMKVSIALLGDRKG
jgi:hypothetical protein